MNSPVSVPISPAQPDQPVYGIAALELFTSYSRETYKATFGVDAPSWDATRRLKKWFDSSVDLSNPKRMVTYLVCDSATGQPGPLTITAAEAATPNLPGLAPYPAWSPAPTASTSQGAPINPDELSTLQQAMKLGITLGGTGISDAGENANYDPADARRLYQITVAGQGHNVGRLLKDQLYKNGVGAPGKWSVTDAGEPVFTPDPLPPDGINQGVPADAAIPVPIRPPASNESITVTAFGLYVEKAVPAAAPPATDQLAAIASDVAWIRKALENMGAK